jgi:lysine-specific histone demethylase 1
MFGLLNEAEHQASLDMKDYASQRGKFYLFWNCIKTSGRPTLVALMAGNAAHYAEANTDEYLIKEVTDRLAKMFAPKSVPLPSEAIVTRWSKDPYARGSYSYVGPRTLAGDYDVMARPHGPLHFAGEATCGTHPATVHGAYLSGLRAAAEVLEGLLGPIEIPSPLVEKKVKVEQPPTPASQPIKHRLEPEAIQQGSANLQQPRPDEEYEASIIAAIRAELGERPSKPGRGVTNPFLLFTKDQWYICKKELDDARRAATGKPDAKASRTEIRGAVGSKWRKASEETRKPYIDRAQSVKDDAAANAVTFKQQIQAWDNEAARIRREYIQNNRPPGGNEHLYVDHAIFEMSSGKRTRRS